MTAEECKKRIAELLPSKEELIQAIEAHEEKSDALAQDIITRVLREKIQPIVCDITTLVSKAFKIGVMTGLEVAEKTIF